MEKRTLSVKEVCELLGISKTRAMKSIKDGDIPAMRFGRRIRIPSAPIEKMLEGK